MHLREERIKSRTKNPYNLGRIQTFRSVHVVKVLKKSLMLTNKADLFDQNTEHFLKYYCH